MAGKDATVCGVYPSLVSLEIGVNELVKAGGIRNQDISILFPESAGSGYLSHERNSKVPEGATVGATTGAVFGGALGWLIGIGALVIPGVGPFIGAGPMVAALAGVGVGGTVGGIAGAMIGMGIPEYQARRYEKQVQGGGLLLSIHSDNPESTRRAKDILRRTGAQDITSTTAPRRGDSIPSSRLRKAG